jgi:hypothetical protein
MLELPLAYSDAGSGFVPGRAAGVVNSEEVITEQGRMKRVVRLVWLWGINENDSKRIKELRAKRFLHWRIFFH